MTTTQFEFDINSTNSTILSFMETYNRPVTFEDDDLIDIFHEHIKKVIMNNEWSDLKDNNTFDKYTYGTKVDVTYSPLSQRYIDYYDEQGFTGILFYGNKYNDDALFYYIQNDIIHVKSLERDNCHYMGMGRGYEYYIKV